MIKYQEKIQSLVSEIYDINDITLELPPDSKLGEIALPCFTLAKKLR
jgi:arginyl-tRNA synthetase